MTITGYISAPQKRAPSIDQIDDIQGKLAPVIDECDLANKEMKVNVVGVSSAHKYQCCCSCKKKIEGGENAVTCPSCNMTQKVSALSVQWVVKLYVEDKASKRMHLTAFDRIVKQMALKVNVKEPMNTISAMDLKCQLLELDELTIVSDTVRNTIIELW